MAGSLGKPRVHDKRGVQGLSLAKEMMEVWTHQEPSPLIAEPPHASLALHYLRGWLGT